MPTRETPHPTELKLRKGPRLLEVSFADGSSFQLPAEYLRVYSPSAEVKGHGAGEGMLVAGKERVNIERIEPVGRYAVRLIFDDGHATGLYTWPILHELGLEHEGKWQRYLERMAQAGLSRSEKKNDGPEQ